MANDRVPEAARMNSSEIVRLVTGMDASVYTHATTRGGMAHAEDAMALCQEVVGKILKAHGIDDSTLRRFGAVAAYATLVQLGLSEGFDVYVGDENRPREIIEVNLRPHPVEPIEAEVTRRTGAGEQ